MLSLKYKLILGPPDLNYMVVDAAFAIFCRIMCNTASSMSREISLSASIENISCNVVFETYVSWFLVHCSSCCSFALSFILKVLPATIFSTFHGETVQ